MPVLDVTTDPETYPATVTTHELTPGGRVNYYMTSPEGEKFGGYWKIIAVQAPTRLEFADGFADADGNANEAWPENSTVVELSATAGGTSMVMTSSYATAEELQKVIEMGMAQGVRSAVGQIDGLLAA